MRGLTRKQINAVQKIAAARRIAHKRFEVEKQELCRMFDRTDLRPTDFVSVSLLLNAHKVSYRDLKALVKKGIIEMRPTDGFGPEVKIIHPAYMN